MEAKARHAWALAALHMGAAFAWLVPCLISAIWHPLPIGVFVAWSALVGLGGFLFEAVLLDRWRS